MSEHEAPPVGAIQDLQRRVAELESRDRQWAETVEHLLQCVETLAGDLTDSQAMEVPNPGKQKGGGNAKGEARS
jgi:hypothetical protein